MKRVCLVLLCLLCAACTNFENPIIGEKGPALDDSLVGRWSAEKDRGRLEVVITRNGIEGKVENTSTERGKEPETETLRLITARIERHDFGSLGIRDEQGKDWRFFRYELQAPGRLTIYLDDEDFWSRAIKDKQVSSTTECATVCKTVVTASSEELRALVQGYGPVIFSEEPVIELTRE